LLPRKRALVFLGLVLLFLICQAVEIQWARNLRGDETFYIQGAYNMLQSGDWITPRYESGRLRFQKPLLTYWLVALPMSLLGVGHGLAPLRLPSLLLALGTLPFVYCLTKALFHDRPSAAFLAMVAHLSMVAFYANAHQARTDAPLAFFVAGAMCFFARVIFIGDHRRRDILLAYGMTAGAVLIKGFAGLGFILLPVAVFIILFWRSIGAARWRAVFSPWGIGTLVLLAAPWFTAIVLRHGSEFLDAFVGDQITERVTGSKWYFLVNVVKYPYLLLRACLPWTLPVAAVLVADDAGVRGVFRERRTPWGFLLTWLGVMLLIFLGANIIRGRYLLPALPVCSTLTGVLLERALGADEPGRGLLWGLRLTALWLLTTALVLAARFGLLACAGGEATLAAPTMALLLVLGGALLLRFARRAQAGGVLACAALGTLWMFAVSLGLFPEAPGDVARKLARDVIAPATKDTRIATVGVQKQVRSIILAFTGRRVQEFCDSSEPEEQALFLKRFLSQPGPKLILLDAKAYSTLPDDIRSACVIVATGSGLGDMDFAAWRRSPSPTWFSLLQASTVTLHVLRPTSSSPRDAETLEEHQSVGEPPHARLYELQHPS